MIAGALDGLREGVEYGARIVDNGGQFSMFDFTSISNGQGISLIKTEWRWTDPISPPYTSTMHSNPIHTPRIGILPEKYLIASLDTPESFLG